MLLRFQVFIEQSSRQEVSWDSFLKPFSFTLWLCVVFSIILISAMLHVMYLTLQRHQEYQHVNRFLYFDSLYRIFGVFCLQGKHHFIFRASLSYYKLQILLGHKQNALAVKSTIIIYQFYALDSRNNNNIKHGQAEKFLT